MSKEAALRAMREARYTERLKRSGPVAPASPARTPAPVAPPRVEKGATAAESESCGHRSMNGRTCTREQGHTAKNHRYS